MGEEKLTKLMWNLGLGVIHKIPSNGNEHQVDEGHGKFNNWFQTLSGFLFHFFYSEFHLSLMIRLT